MKHVILNIIVLVICSVSSYAQINEDAKKIARKGIKEMTLDNGQCILKFDTLGRLTEMIITYRLKPEIYQFDIFGNWIYYEQFERRKKGLDYVEYTLRNVTNTYDSTNELIYQVAVDFKDRTIRGTSPERADTLIYQNVKSVDTTKLSFIEFKSSATLADPRSIPERNNYQEETELIYKINDTTYQVDYFEIQYNDTIWHSKYRCFVNEKNIVVGIYRYDLVSNQIDTQYNDCKSIGNHEYNCFYLHESGAIISSRIKTRRILYSKEVLNKDLPESTYAHYNYTYYESPLKALKASKKSFGENSIKIILY